MVAQLQKSLLSVVEYPLVALQVRNEGATWKNVDGKYKCACLFDRIVFPVPPSLPSSLSFSLSLLYFSLLSYQVATTYQKQFKEWQSSVKDWKSEIHKSSLRWAPSWDVNSTAAFAAIETWLAKPAEVMPCRSALQWPESQPKN